MPGLAVLPLLKYRELLFAWTGRILRARYQQSLLGGLWAVIQPIAVVAVFTVVFTRLLKVETHGVPYVVFAYTGMVPWTLLSTSITDMVDSLVTNMSLVTKIYFPRAILPMAAVLARLIDCGIASLLLVGLLVYYRMPVRPEGLLYLPLVLVVQLLLIVGLGLAGAALNVFLRDIKHLFTLALQLWLYATPIIYPVELVPETLRPWYFLNPMAGVIEAYRAVLLRGELPGSYLWISAVSALVICLCGLWFFQRTEYQFADIV